MWVTAIIIGLAGSLHCLGMCSPLAMAVTNLRSPFFINRLVYNGGRIFSYGLLGAFFSAFGTLFHFFPFQNLLTVIIGCTLIFFGIAGISKFRIPFITPLIQYGTIRLKNLFSKFLMHKTFLSVAVMGMLNGLLPCGLTYIALTYCITLPHFYDGFFFMVIFGLGTLPVMLGLTSFLQVLITRFNISFQKITTIVLITLGILLISRSLMEHHNNTIVPSEEIVICK